MIRCTRRIEFDAGHRVIGHKHKCKFLHGHRYALEVTMISQELDNCGMVIDFGTIKEVMQQWIDDNFDHTLILHNSDKILGDSIENITGQKVYYLDSNPTAENIALHLKDVIIPELFANEGINLDKIRLFETPKCFVEV